MDSPPANSLDVAISGGPMGGLFAGIELRAAGHDATIFERSTGGVRSIRGRTS